MKRLYENQNREDIHLRKPVRSFFFQVRYVAVRWFLIPVFGCALASAQISGISPATSNTQPAQSSPTLQGSGSSSSNTSYGGGSGATATSILSQSPYSGSVPEGKATSEVLPLSFKDAIDRALRNNLGVLLESDNTLAARGQKWHELSALLPHVSASANQSVEQIDLAALGFRFTFPGIPNVIGPLGIWQSQVSLSQSIFDFNAIERNRGASANLEVSRLAYKDARDIVVLAAGNAYLETLASAARVETAQAQLITAQTVYDRSVDQQKAGVSPAIDVLRARVQLQSQQQQLIVAKNNYAKEKLTLGRTIGLPPGQEFSLTDKAPYAPLAAMGVQEALQRAYATRPDYMAAAQQVRSAEYLRRAATAEHYPTLSIAGYYGDAGIRPGSSHGVFQAGVTLDIPIFAGGKVHGDVLESEASLRQARQKLENLRGQIDLDVRSALLDLASAAEQVEVARSTVDLANQTLIQSQDRFTAGVTDNLEVVQAQQSVTSANDNYISSLYAHNLAKVELARAIGFAEQSVRLYLQGK